MEIGHISFQDLAARQVRQAERTDTTGFTTKLEQAHRAAAAQPDVIPASPPRDVLAEVQRAAARAQELAQANRELHFQKDPSSGRIVVQVKDLDGNVLRTIPPSAALDVMSGAGL